MIEDTFSLKNFYIHQLENQIKNLNPKKAKCIKWNSYRDARTSKWDLLYVSNQDL